MRPAGVPFAWAGPRAASRLPSKPLVGPGLVVVLAVILGLLLTNGGSGPAFQWGLGVLGLAVLAVLAWRWLRKGTADPQPLWRPGRPAPVRSGEIEALSQTLRRAVRGLPYSQLVATSRARAAFLDRVRLAHGLSSETLRRTEADPEALRRLVRDEVLVDFLHLPTGEIEERYRWVLEARGRGGFARAFRDVLDRMEAWR